MTCSYVMHVPKSTDTLHYLPLTSTIHQSQTFSSDTYLCREYMYVTMLTIILLLHSNIQLFKFDTDRQLRYFHFHFHYTVYINHVKQYT